MAVVVTLDAVYRGSNASNYCPFRQALRENAR
jgi:hypothetical protein